VAVSLYLLTGAVEALRTSIVDDVHVGNRFADLVETLTYRIRSRFVRLVGNGSSTGISRAASRSPVPAPMMPPPLTTPNLHASGRPPHGSYMSASSSVFPHPNPANSSSSIPGSPSQNSSGAGGLLGRATPILQNLWGINPEPYDPTSNRHSVMPPPPPSNFYTQQEHGQPTTPGGSSNPNATNPNNSSNSNSNNNNNNNENSSNGNATANPWSTWLSHTSNSHTSTNTHNNGNNNGGGAAGPSGWHTPSDAQDWLTIPLDPLLDQWGAEINQTAMGPDIGGMDMLDILLNMGGPPGNTS
jgi:hypothetical protein